MNNEPSAQQTDDRTMEIDRTVVLSGGNSRKGKKTKQFTDTGFLSQFKKRRDVDLQIEELRDRPAQRCVEFSGGELELDELENRYELEERIAEGGQGTLFRGLDKKLRRLVAIKSLHPEKTDDLRQRRLFLTEARVTAQLDHPAIVPVYTLNSDRKHGLHLSMKMINGITLKAYLEQVCTHYRLDGVSSFDEEKAIRNRLEIFLKVCDALEYAHSRNVMHCDLKPANIMIGEYHEAYIMDWGIAHAIQPEKPDRPLAGTPQYLSPEAILGKPCDQRADIFAMGAILFETVMLKPAFSGETAEEVMANIRDGAMEPETHRFGTRVSRDLKAIIRKALAGDPDCRYQQIRELSADLRRCLMGLEVSANPDDLFQKMIRWSKIHWRTTLILLLAALLIGAGALSYSLYQSYRFSEEMRRRDYALGVAYSVCSRAAYLLDEQFLKLEQMTSLLAADVRFLLEHDIHETPVRQSYHHISRLRRMHSPTMLYSPFHRGTIDPAALVYNTTADTRLPDPARRLEPFARFIPRLLQMILASPRDARIVPDNMEAMKQQAFSRGTPAIRILFGFSDGLYIAYPASGAFPERYDPRTRTWYKAAFKNRNSGPVWTLPYMDSIPEIGLVISCCAPLFLQNGTDGVCAIDISIPKMIEELRASGNSARFVEEKAIVDAEGRIIVSSPQKSSPGHTAGSGQIFAGLNNPALLDYIKKRNFGIRIWQNDQGEEVVYSFCHIRSVNWFYIERMNLRKLLETL